MKKLTYPIAFFLPLIAILMCQSAFAQKLPKVQTSGVWAPANIKIDGKTTEWNDRFRAHNSGNHIYYTLSNDDNNLYLTARMEDIDGDNKIFKGGITFTIVPVDKKAEKISVTFPVMSWEKRADMGNNGGNHLFLYKELKADTIANRIKIDSLIAKSNTEITQDYKELYVTGIPGLGDPLLSVYNTQGIKVAASFDKKMRYRYELAIPLKYLNVAISNVKSIKYNIRLNVTPVVKRKVSNRPMDVVQLGPPIGPPSIDDLFNYEDSEFSGVYTLAIKP